MLGDEDVVVGFLGLLDGSEDLRRIGDAWSTGIRILEGLELIY